MSSSAVIYITKEGELLSQEYLVVLHRVIGVFRHNKGEIPANEGTVEFIVWKLYKGNLRLNRPQLKALVEQVFLDMYRAKEVWNQGNCFVMLPSLWETPRPEKQPAKRKKKPRMKRDVRHIKPQQAAA